MSPRRITRKKIGELLIERHIITPEQLSISLQEQELKGGYISQHLISLGFATEFDIANCLASQYDFAYLPLDNYTVPAYVLEIIPLKLIKIFSILPVDKMGRVITVAMVDPLNEGVIEMLRQITNCDIEIFISTYGELNKAINKYFGQRLKELSKHAITEEDLKKEDIVQSFIQTVSYKGQERRRYKRVAVELDMEYFLQGKIFKAKTENLSYIGILFICDSFIPVDTNILTKIYIKKDMFIDVVIQIVRVEKITEIKQTDASEASKGSYGIAGFFNFISDDDKNKLILFLKPKHGS